jgi:hypothetical protein
MQTAVRRKCLQQINNMRHAMFQNTGWTENAALLEDSCCRPAVSSVQVRVNVCSYNVSHSRICAVASLSFCRYGNDSANWRLFSTWWAVSHSRRFCVYTRDVNQQYSLMFLPYVRCICRRFLYIIVSMYLVWCDCCMFKRLTVCGMQAEWYTPLL